MISLMEQRQAKIEAVLEKLQFDNKLLWQRMEVGDLKKGKGLNRWRSNCKKETRLHQELQSLSDLGNLGAGMTGKRSATARKNIALAKRQNGESKQLH